MSKAKTKSSKSKKSAKRKSVITVNKIEVEKVVDKVVPTLETTDYQENSPYFGPEIEIDSIVDSKEVTPVIIRPEFDVIAKPILNSKKSYTSKQLLSTGLAGLLLASLLFSLNYYLSHHKTGQLDSPTSSENNTLHVTPNFGGTPSTQAQSSPDLQKQITNSSLQPAQKMTPQDFQNIQQGAPITQGGQ